MVVFKDIAESLKITLKSFNKQHKSTIKPHVFLWLRENLTCKT